MCLFESQSLQSLMNKNESTMKNVLFSLLFLFCIAQLNAQRISTEKVPAAVKTAFQKAFPKATDIDWEKENNAFEAEFELETGEEITAVFSPEGVLLEIEQEMTVSTLPQPVLDALKGKRIKEASKITKADGAIVYEAEVKRKDLLFDASGKPL